MIDVASIYYDASQRINTPENGDLSFELFNSLSRQAELDLIDALTGNIFSQAPPAAYTTQKDKDWLSVFIKKLPAQVNNATIPIPADYYTYDNLYRIGGEVAPVECDEEATEHECDTAIEILTGGKFYNRCHTHIEGLQPSFFRPIAKETGSVFEFLPKDLGSVVLEYIRYPVFARIIPTLDIIFNTQVIDPVASKNYEWPEKSRKKLVQFIADGFAAHTRENALKQTNQTTENLVRL